MDYKTYISIHAPAQGATYLTSVDMGLFFISIHAPAQGATRARHIDRVYDQAFQSTLPHRERPALPGSKRWELGNFNPRSRTGSDIIKDTFNAVLNYFNPRSRTGSDGSPTPCHSSGSYFNPRSRTGSNIPSPPRAIHGDKFQSTLPHRERRPILKNS